MAGTPAIWVLGCSLLLISYCAGESSHECHRNLSLKRQMNTETLRLLEKLNDIPYYECQQNNATATTYLSKFLNKMTKVSPENLRTIIHYTEKLFKENKIPTTKFKLDENVTDSLRGLLLTMSQTWTECIYNQMNLATTKLPKLVNSTKRITSHFRRMDNYLNTEGYSPCAWSSVIAEVQKVLIFVTQQTDRMTIDKDKLKAQIIQRSS